MPDYQITNTSYHTANVDDVTLSTKGDDSNALTRRILRPELVDNAHDKSSSVKATIRHQRRKSKNDPWEDADSYNLATVKGGQEIKLELSCDETVRLYKALRDLYAVGKDGAPKDDRTLTVADADTVIIATGQEKRAVAQLLERGDESLWDAINELQPNALAAIGRAKLHESRRKAFEEFEQQLSANEWNEHDWERFFRTNKWIFGYGLAYQFLSEIQGQPHYGGTTLAGTGGQRGDFYMATQANHARFTVLVDIKTPGSPLLTKPYRNKVYEMGRDLVGAVSQLQSNCRTWVIDGSRQENNVDNLRDQGISTYEPKGVLVIGMTAQLDSMDKRANFELFRRNLHNPEIITYDELLERARFIVMVEEEAQTADTAIVDIDAEVVSAGEYYDSDLMDLADADDLSFF